MSAPRDPDAILAAWLEEGPTVLPEPTRRAIAVATRATDRSRHPFWMPLRRPTMNTYARLAVALVAIAIAVGGAAYFLAPAGKIGGPPIATPSVVPSPSASAAVSPSAAPTPTATAAPSPTTLAKEGFVYPGRYVPAFQPSLTITIDREVQHHCAPNFQCRGSIDVNEAGWLGLEFGQPRIEIDFFRVDKVNDPAHPGRLMDPPSDLAAWIASRPGVTVANPPTPVTVGGLSGTQFDLDIGDKDVSIGPIPGMTDIGLGFAANYRSRYIVVKVQTHQVLIALSSQDPFAASMAELQPLVDSIAWN
jgi:hypothetical protein